jgi:hypothetical protein
MTRNPSWNSIHAKFFVPEIGNWPTPTRGKKPHSDDINSRDLAREVGRGRGKERGVGASLISGACSHGKFVETRGREE